MLFNNNIAKQIEFVKNKKGERRGGGAEDGLNRCYSSLIYTIHPFISSIYHFLIVGVVLRHYNFSMSILYQRESKIFFCLVLFLTGPLPLYAEDGVVFRPHIGFGYSSSSNGIVSHVGGRLLLDAGDNRRYGLEATYFNLKDIDDFTSFGIILEQRLWMWFNMSIGTIGYFGYGKNSGNPAGLVTNLGWEPEIFKNLKPFINYRNDFIFHDDTAKIYSLSAGLNWHF